jgi:hypothetical protein
MQALTHRNVLKLYYVDKTMRTFISFLKSKRLSQLMVGGIAALFLLVNTACSQPNVLGADGKIVSDKVAASSNSLKVASPYREDTDNIPEGQVTKFYDPIQPVEGGMNNYRDVDPRQDTSKSDAKAEKLIRKAKANKFDNPLDVVKKELADEPITERVQKFSKNVGKSAQKTADDLSQVTQKSLNNMSEGSRDLRNKTQSAAQTLTQKAEHAGDIFNQAAKSIGNKTQQSVDEVQSFIDKEGGSA